MCGLQGNWRNEDGWHCAKHAREAGVYMRRQEVKRKCVNDNKEAYVRDPANNDALCGACATARGIKYKSCVMCPAETAYVGSWSHPQTKKPLCAAHAREMGVYLPQNKSEDIYDDLVFIYEDESVLDLILKKNEKMYHYRAN